MPCTFSLSKPDTTHMSSKLYVLLCRNSFLCRPALHCSYFTVLCGETMQEKVQVCRLCYGFTLDGHTFFSCYRENWKCCLSILTHTVITVTQTPYRAVKGFYFIDANARLTTSVISSYSIFMTMFYSFIML